MNELSRRCLTILLALLACTASQIAYAQNNVEVLHVRGPLYMFSAGGVNVVASIGPDGVLLVDSGAAAMSDQIMAAVRDVQKQLSMVRALASSLTLPTGGAETRSSTQAVNFTAKPPEPVRFILNTNAHLDHTGGNAKMSIKSNVELSSQDPGEITTHLYAHENVLQRVSGASGDTALPYEFWPSDTYFSQYYKLTSYFNGEGVQLIHVPKANTDGDSFVWFRGSDVIVAGDIYRTDAYPIPELKMGGNIQGVIEGLNQLLDMAIPEYRQEGGTLVIPGHGRLSDSGDVAGYRDMVTIIRDRVKHMIDQGKTLEQIQAAKLDLDYAARYGKEAGSSARFIEAIYRSLTQVE